MQHNRKHVFVSGSSQGIGQAIAEEFANQGHIVVVHGSRNTDYLDAVYKKVKNLSPNSICVTGDLSDSDKIEQIFDKIRSVFGGLDVLINNAAMQNPAPFLELKLEDWDRIMAVNLRASFLCGQYAGRMMKERGGGRIINISSVHDTAPRRYFAHYSTSKGGLNMLTKCMALELADFNIQVNSITAGGFATQKTDPERAEKVIPSIPANRIGESEEIAKLINYLVSPEASYITGSSITIDGGLLLGFCATRRDL